MKVEVSLPRCQNSPLQSWTISG